MSHGMSFGGQVIATNGSKFQLRTGDGDEWLPISKWAEAGTAMPRPGEVVEVKVDAKGFVRAIRLVGQPKPETQPAAPATVAPSDRETHITRMACLNTATAILSSGSRACEAKDVVALAAKLEQWVLR